MLINLDIAIIGIIDVLVVLLLTGYVSLCERRVLAIVQIRIGPALCLFGLLTPVTDGLKLFLKFIVFVGQVEVVSLVAYVFVAFAVLFVA